MKGPLFNVLDRLAECDTKRVTPAMRLLAVYIARRMDAYGVCFTGCKTLARETGLDLRTVRRTLPALVSEPLGIFARDFPGVTKGIRHGSARFTLTRRTVELGGSHTPPREGLTPPHAESMGGSHTPPRRKHGGGSRPHVGGSNAPQKTSEKTEERESPGFARLWTVYPAHRRGDRRRALSLWTERDESRAAEIVSTVEAFKRGRIWKGREGDALTFAPTLARFLRDGMHEARPEDVGPLKVCPVCGTHPARAGSDFCDACRDLGERERRERERKAADREDASTAAAIFAGPWGGADAQA